MGWSPVPWPSAGTSMGDRANRVTGRTSPRSVRSSRSRPLDPRLVQVHVRVGVVADQRVGLLHHPRVSVRVEVEGRHHRHAGTDGLADGGQQGALRVGIVVEDHRAVERQEDAVERARRGQPLEERVPHGGRTPARGTGPRRGRWRRPSGRPRPRRNEDVEEPADLGPLAA